MATFTDDRKSERSPWAVFSLRLPNDIKAALEHRAELRLQAGEPDVTPSQIARELIEKGLGVKRETPPTESLLDEVMVSALFAKRALELVLSTHDGVAEKLLRAARQQVHQSKRQYPPRKKRKKDE